MNDAWGFSKIIAVVLMGLLVWLIIRNIKKIPQFFSKENLGKSFYTMGILAIILIIVIGFMLQLIS